MPQKLDALSKAIDENHCEAIRIILESTKVFAKDVNQAIPSYKLNLSKFDSNGENIICKAIRKNNKEALLKLIADMSDADLNLIKQYVKIDNEIFELTPLDVAIYFRYVDIIKVLLKKFNFSEEFLKKTLNLDSWRTTKSITEIETKNKRPVPIVTFENLFPTNNINTATTVNAPTTVRRASAVNPSNQFSFAAPLSVPSSLQSSRFFNQAQIPINDEIKSLIICYQYLKRAVTSNTEIDRLISINQAMKANTDFTIECLHDIITEIKVVNNPLTNLLKKDNQNNSSILRLFLESIALFFNACHRESGSYHVCHHKYDDILIHLSILYQDNVAEANRPFKSITECGSFIERYAMNKPDWSNGEANSVNPTSDNNNFSSSQAQLLMQQSSVFNNQQEVNDELLDNTSRQNLIPTS